MNEANGMDDQLNRIHKRVNKSLICRILLCQSCKVYSELYVSQTKAIGKYSSVPIFRSNSTQHDLVASQRDSVGTADTSVSHRPLACGNLSSYKSNLRHTAADMSSHSLATTSPSKTKPKKALQAIVTDNEALPRPWQPLPVLHLQRRV